MQQHNGFATFFGSAGFGSRLVYVNFVEIPFWGHINVNSAADVPKKVKKKTHDIPNFIKPFDSIAVWALFSGSGGHAHVSMLCCYIA